MNISTADLCDKYDPELELRIAEPIFRRYGARANFAGQVATLRVFEDNTLLRAALETPGEGRVLVVDGGASTRCALMGDLLAGFALDNAWAGVVINGCIRDSAAINQIAIGIRALTTMPRKSKKQGRGEKDVVLHIAGINIAPGNYLYADADGIVVAERKLSL